MASGSSARVATILWFIAAALALSAAVIDYSRRGEIKWALFAAFLFLAAMGISAARRSKSTGV